MDGPQHRKGERMKDKPQSKGAAGMLAGLTAGHKQAETDRRLAADADRGRAVAVVAVESIHRRKDDSRPARAVHVLALAESIAAVGLLQPLALDRNARLVAGLHRLEAVRLLLAGDRAAAFAALAEADKVDAAEAAHRLRALPPVSALAEPLKGGRVPVRLLLDLDAEGDPAAALAAEAAENTARKNYTPAEVSALAERLRAAGYRDTAGRPRKGEKAMRPALALVLGVHVDTVRRSMGEKGETGKPRQVPMFSETLPRLARAVAATLKAGDDLPKGDRKARRLLAALQTLAADLEELTTAKGKT